MHITNASKPATIEDLLRVEGQAELIRGTIVRYKPFGALPSIVSGRIYLRLHRYLDTHLSGIVGGATLGYSIPELPSGRESFSPGVSYYDGPLPANLMRFIEGAPTFAVEVRSESDYTPVAEREMASKRIDYFAAGTKAVWDVDPIQQVIRLYVDDAEVPVAVFRVGDQAHAEPAVMGWKLDVARLFRS